MTFKDALGEWVTATAKTVANNKAALGAIPDSDDPYYIWARLARQNTGRSLCDSGGAYGYMYERPVRDKDAPALSLHFYKGRMESATVCTIHWLDAFLDPTDDEAASWQKLLEWTGGWLHPRENWFTCLSSFQEDLAEICDYVDEGHSDDPPVITNRDLYVLVSGHAMSEYDLPRAYQSNFQTKAPIQWMLFHRDAVRAFPRDAVTKLAEYNVRVNEFAMGDSFNVCNGENDFSQVFQASNFDAGSISGLVVMTHNGADVRGGYSSPLIAAYKDYAEDYSWSWLVDFYCTGCDEEYEMSYYYDEALKKSDAKEIPELDQDRIDAYKVLLELHKNVELGQLSLDGIKYIWPGKHSLEATKAMVLWWDERDDDEPFPIQAMFKNREDEMFPFLDEDTVSVGLGTAGSYIVLWCPKCGTYNVLASHPVDGY